ncbi:ABC1 kinase family protein [Methylomonas koyamae]|uniref:Ubiquinone biosynthesis protein UbiB n=1 Tax=Methylomonas koyamae TaxID=702114 RepID=A0AA91I538_9GAMM|nr:AarF/UbiB family protein [Methylomonas koyamae]OAI25792.1 ubiquinone biosynthesis protein UbiB [Methylomonas koyamae]
MIYETLKVARDLGRIHDISSILIRYGFGDVVRRLGIANVVEKAGHILNWNEIEDLTSLAPPVRVRRALEDMGPTFIKLGQILATRADLFPPEWIIEFKRLQDQVQTVPYEKIVAQIQEDLGGIPEEIFAEFYTQPLAAASISQVYKARLQDGSPVIVKIRRPGVRAIVEADLRLLTQLAEIAEHEINVLQHYRPKEIVHQFTLSMRRELDLATECRNAERVAKSFTNYPNIIIPKVYWQWTCERINVQEFIEGIPGHQIDKLDQAGFDRKLLAKRGSEAILKMILEDGFFHADPHPGNCFYLDGNRIAFIDFGMVGRLSEDRRDQVIGLLKGLVDQETQRVINILLKWSENTPVQNKESLILDIDEFIDLYHDIPLNELNITTLLDNLTTILREHQLNLPPDLTLLLKAFVTLEGFGRQLDPEFNLVEDLSPHLQAIFAARYSPDALLKWGKNNLFNLFELFKDLPKDLQQFIDALKRNALGIKIDFNEPVWLRKELDRVVNRLSISLVTSALIVGSSIVTTVEGGSSSLFGLMGFVGSVLGGIWLILSIWHSE